MDRPSPNDALILNSLLIGQPGDQPTSFRGPCSKLASACCMRTNDSSSTAGNTLAKHQLKSRRTPLGSALMPRFSGVHSNQALPMSCYMETPAKESPASSTSARQPPQGQALTPETTMSVSLTFVPMAASPYIIINLEALDMSTLSLLASGLKLQRAMCSRVM